MRILKTKQKEQRTLDECAEIVVKPFNWRAYNDSQAREKIMFLRLLDDLCNMIDEDKFTFNGRRPKSFSHMVFCMCLKVYLGTSSRRLISDIELCQRRKYLNSVPHFNSVLNYFNNPRVKYFLKNLIELSAMPLAQLETKFAVDSTGFSERKYLDRWSRIRQEFSKHRQYRKAHCIYGVQSNIISTCIITEGTKNDSPYFKELLQRTADNFDVKEVSADLGYSSRENMEFADQLGISPFIPFKKNATGNAKGSRAWHKMFKYFKYNNEEFMKNYHLRSNAESGFFMIKQRFGDFINSKKDISQDNEILCKILCHNICVIIQEIFLSKIDVDFLNCAKTMVAQQEN